MAKQSFYTPGKKPQYGRSRWSRYESLRQSGFTKSEARELSRGYRTERGTTAWSPQKDKVMSAWVRNRERLQSKFFRDTVGSGTYMQFIRYIRDWYDRGGHTSRQGKRTPANRGGKPDIMQAYHDIENILARREGWRKGKYTPPPAKGTPEFDDWHEQEAERKRRRKKSPNAKHYKGDVKAQKRRAKARSASFEERKLPVESLKKILRDSIAYLGDRSKKIPTAVRRHEFGLQRNMRRRIADAEARGSNVG